jgi:pimeloyl-ACP methyl ester carboxylesterase
MKRYSAFVIGIIILSALFCPIPAVWGGESGGGATPAASVSNATTAQSVRVGDIDIGYRIMGAGEPVVLITGYSATMDMWDPLLIKELSARYRVILFDNRGIGRTTASDRPFSIGLFAEDTVGLMNALGIKKAHVVGWSMGTFIATEMALKYPEKVDKLVLYAGSCGWNDKDAIKSSPEVSAALMDLSGTGEERAKRLIGVLFPKQWLEEHPDFVKGLPRPGTPVSLDSIERQGAAIGAWAGACDRLGKIVQPTLIITGTEDVVIPPGNSQMMASRIPGSWLIRIPGGHSNMYQYPDLFSRCLLGFLQAQNK